MSLEDLHAIAQEFGVDNYEDQSGIFKLVLRLMINLRNAKGERNRYIAIDKALIVMYHNIDHFIGTDLINDINIFLTDMQSLAIKLEYTDPVVEKHRPLWRIVKKILTDPRETCN